MLDEAGTVVCWYGRDEGGDLFDENIVGQHFKLFYVPEDIELSLPSLSAMRCASVRP